MEKAYTILLTLLLITTLYCCKKPDNPTCFDGTQNQNEVGIDCGGPCSNCASCSDGIQNQNETGIDCGGLCTACVTVNQLCDGIGSDSFWPLALGNSWHYNSVIDSIVSQSGSTFTFESGFKLRVDSIGNIYATLSVDEVLFLPCNLSIGQTWMGVWNPAYTSTWTVRELNVSVTTPYCSYTDCLLIEELAHTFQGHTGWYDYLHVTYYKKGIGVIVQPSGSKLSSVKLN